MKHAIITLITILPLAGPATADDAPKVHRDLISSIGSERATSGNGNKIVTADGQTHIVWQDATEEGYFARVRTLNRETGNWSPTRTLLRGRDNHSRPNMTIDSQGYLHVVMGGHQRLQWLKSKRPNDITEWTKPVSLDPKRNNTYPVIVCGPDDTLYLTARHDTGWAGMDFYVKRPTEKWQHRGLLVRKKVGYTPGTYAAYHNGLAWGPDHKTLHMSTIFFMSQARKRVGRELEGLHQAVGYMRSEDFGKTWTKADGSPIELPATTESIDLIDEGIRDADATDKPKPGIRHCGIAVDSQNRPHVVYVRHTPEAGRIFLVTPDDNGGWERRPLQEAIQRRWPGLAAIDGDMSISRDDVLCLMLTLAPLKHPKANWSPGIYGRPSFWLRDYPNIQQLVWLESRDGGRTFNSRDIVTHDPDRGTLLPTLESPTGFNGVATGQLPPLLYFEGLSRYRKPGEIIQNNVYFLQPR